VSVTARAVSAITGKYLFKIQIFFVSSNFLAFSCLIFYIHCAQIFVKVADPFFLSGSWFLIKCAIGKNNVS
jgi:hypothetical protein